MKIKECLANSLNKVKLDNGVETYTMVLPGFLRSMSIVLLADAYMRLQLNVPDMNIDGTTYKGKSKKNPKFEDFANVLNGNDMLRAVNQHRQLMGFLEWLLEEDSEQAEKEGYGYLWYEPNFIIQKWNEFAAIGKDDK